MASTSPTLLDRLSRGTDRVAWDRFVELYAPLLTAWCRQMGASDADAADLTQSVFLTLVEQLPKFRYDPDHSFRAWLKTVLLNAWRNHLRKNKAGSPNASGGADPDQIPDTDPGRHFEEAEYRAHLVQRALSLMRQNFEPSTWQACWEFVVNDRPASAVAAELGLTVNAVYLAKSRVLRHLRHELQGFLN